MVLGGLQPGYLPWLGFFEQAFKADIFLICDEFQYDKKSWRNRNRIKSNNGISYLTVPVINKGTTASRINAVRIDNGRDWRKKHWASLRNFYGNTQHFGEYAPFMEEVYGRDWEYLADLDEHLIRYFISALGIKTDLAVQSNLNLEEKFRKAHSGGDATDRLVFLCKEFGADALYEGASGRGYIDEVRLQEAGIKVTYQDYVHPVYPQLYGGFVPHLSIVDLLFNCGNDSLGILTGGKGGHPE